jgi:hypothetical protein
LPQSNVGVSCRIQPQRTSTNSRIVDTRRRTQRSLKAYSHVVHIGVADRVLVAEGVVTDGYGLVAFDVFAEGVDAHSGTFSAPVVLQNKEASRPEATLCGPVLQKVQTTPRQCCNCGVGL